MAIGSVIDLIDYEKRTIEIAKKYGGSGTGDFKKSDMAPAWSSSLVYDRGDIVLYKGKFYFALIDNFVQESGMNPESMEYWLELGTIDEALGYMREDLKEYTDDKVESFDLSLIADKYDETHQYPANDMVVYNNKLYKSTTAVNTPGAFDETMWTEYLPYDSSNTYNTGDYATYEVDGNYKCFRCDEDNVTGEWDDTKWTDVSDLEFPSYDYANSTPYYPNVSKVALRYPGSYRYFIANSTYTPTGGAGTWNSAKWTETTVETLIKALKPIQVFIPQFTTDANGCVWLESPAMEGIREPFSISITHDSAFNGFTGRVEILHKYVNDGAPSYTTHDYIGFKFYDGNGNALANWSSVQSLGMRAGISFLYYGNNI